MQGNIIGVATTYRARPTSKSPGSVQLTNDDKEKIWLSVDVINIANNTWVLTSNANLRYTQGPQGPQGVKDTDKTAWGDQKKTATVCKAYNNIKDYDIVID